MFKFNIKLLYFFGSNVVVNNIYCVNTVKKDTIKLILPNGKGIDVYSYTGEEFGTDKDTFEEVLAEIDLENFLFKGTKFTVARKGGALFKIENIDSHKIFFDKKSSIDFKFKYYLYYTDNYINSTDDSTIKIQNKDNSDYTEYIKKYRLFIDRFQDISNENELKIFIYGLNKDISNDFKNIDDITENYYIEEFKIYPYTIIDNKKPFSTTEIRKITKDYSNKKIEIKLSKYNKYSLDSINLTSDLSKICKKKVLTEVITKINRKISKSRKKLTYDDIQNIITNVLRYDGIILNNNLTDNLIYSFNITIKGDPKNHFTEPKKCTIQFVSNEFELEDKFKKPIEIIFDDKVNEGIEVKEYIFKKYNLNDTNCEIKNEGGNKVPDKVKFADGYQRNIIITNYVAGITKKKEADNVIINIEITSDKSTEFKLKDNVVKNTQIVLKKGSCKINDLLTKLNENGYNGIEQDGIIKEIFLTAKPSNNILESTEDLKGGEYKILLSGQENNFVEKKIKKPTKKNITLTIVPKDTNKYELKGISSNITINVPENISYKDFVDEVKKTIIDGKFEVYIDNNKVENVNININKQIIIKLLDDCNKLKKIKEDDNEDNKGKGNGNGNVGGDDGGNNGNESDKNDTKSKKKYPSSKK